MPCETIHPYRLTVANSLYGHQSVNMFNDNRLRLYFGNIVDNNNVGGCVNPT